MDFALRLSSARIFEKIYVRSKDSSTALWRGDIDRLPSIEKLFNSAVLFHEYQRFAQLWRELLQFIHSACAKVYCLVYEVDRSMCFPGTISNKIELRPISSLCMHILSIHLFELWSVDGHPQLHRSTTSGASFNACAGALQKTTIEHVGTFFVEIRTSRRIHKCDKWITYCHNVEA